MTYNEREAVTCITNIDNALLQLEIFPNKATAACEVINGLLRDMNDGGLEPRDRWRYDFYVSLQRHLMFRGAPYPCCEAVRRVESVPGDATTLTGGECPIHGKTVVQEKE